MGISTASVVGGNLIITLSNTATINVGTVVGTAGATGNTGVSISTASIVSNNLIITLSNNATINVGTVVGTTGATGNTGSQGIQGATGNTGVGISTASIVSGNLIITLSNTSTINTGTVVGTAGANGATTFSALTDVAGLTVDKFYLPAITKLTVTASGSSAYLFDQYAGNNPTIYAISGTTIAFDLSALTSPSHPFLIRFSGANYDTGLVHVTTTGVVTTGSAAQGKTSGTLYWKIPANISGSYGYLCSNHPGGMIGTITVKDISTI